MRVMEIFCQPTRPPLYDDDRLHKLGFSPYCALFTVSTVVILFSYLLYIVKVYRVAVVIVSYK
jgi:hypothetical protein